MKSKDELRKDLLEANRRISVANVGVEYAREYRDLVVLEAWEAGLLYREIGEVMGVTVGYVAQLITRAKEAS